MLEWHVRTGGRLAEGLTPQSLSQYMVAVVDGVVLHYLLSGDSGAAERSLKQVETHVWQLMGLSPRTAKEMDQSK